MRNFLLIVSLLASFFLYIPVYRRALRRRTTGDFSKTAQWIIVFLQFNNLVIAWLDHSLRLTVIYSVNGVMAAALLYFVYKFYD